MDLTRQLQNAIPVIDHWLAYNVYADPRIPGLSAGIVYEDNILFSKGYGYADLSRKLPTTENTCYCVASISKIFTTVAILQLVEQGKVHLDAAVEEYLPWFTSATDANLPLITVRHLLTHTSGLERDGETPHWIDFQFPPLSMIEQHIAAGATAYSPLEMWKYSNYGFTILGQVIQQVSGMPYEAYVTSHIIERLGLVHTAPTLTDSIVQHLALGYSRSVPHKEKEPFSLIETNSMASATGFCSNVLDLCQFMVAQFDGNTRLLSEQMKREMRRVQWRYARPDADWCLGLENWTVNDRQIYGHGGSFPGYKSRFGMDVERKLGVVVLANAIDAPSSLLVNGMLETINYFITHDQEFAPASSPLENIDACTGAFTSIWDDIDIVAVANQLIYYPLTQMSPVVAVNRLQYEQDGQFRIVSGDGLGSVGETVRFEWQGDTVSGVKIGANPLTRLDYR